MSKSTIFIIAVSAFIVLFGIEQFYGDREINPILFDANAIDSIIIEKNDSSVTIKNLEEIYLITDELKKLSRMYPDRLKVNKGITHIDFFIGEEEYPLNIIYGVYDGIVVNANSSIYYQNDSLNTVAMSLLKKAYGIR